MMSTPITENKTNAVAMVAIVLVFFNPVAGLILAHIALLQIKKRVKRQDIRSGRRCAGLDSLWPADPFTAWYSGGWFYFGRLRRWPFWLSPFKTLLGKLEGCQTLKAL
jgi:hypothetical protein